VKRVLQLVILITMPLMEYVGNANRLVIHVVNL